MALVRDSNGTWNFEKEIPAEWNSHYAEAVKRYVNILDGLFRQACNVCEFEFLLTLFRVRSLQDPGWDTYETFLRAIKSIDRLNNEIEDYEVQKHLQLWVYGHIVEASEPYEMIANLIDISQGGRFNISRFPNYKKGRPQSPKEKIQQIEAMANKAGIPDVVIPLREIWSRDLRNAIFHSDYCLHGTEVRIMSPPKIFSQAEISIITNRALAYFESLENFYKLYISIYREPKVIDVHPEFQSYPNEKVVVIVREGHGAVGIKHNWSLQELCEGKIPYRVGRFYPEEVKLLDEDPTRNFLPKRKT